jgi:hypothetical protein
MSDSNFEIVNPQELREDMLLRLLAVFVQRFGGEVVIAKNEFDMLEGVEVFANQTTPEHLRLRLYYDLGVDMEDDSPEDK